MHRRGFTLVELLAVVAVIAIVAAILYPVMAGAKLKAKIARVHSDLQQVGTALEMYRDDCGGLPPVRESCIMSSAIDYYELPSELHKLHYLSTRRMYDPFNWTQREDGQENGRTYKYLAINWGYCNGSKSEFTMWIPRDYPAGKDDCILYYRSRNQIYAYDRGVSKPRKAPIMWALWSVGPQADPGWAATGSRMLPVPRSQWYPYREDGVIVRLSDGRKSP